MKLILCLLFSFFVLAGASFARKPNVILILADDLGYAELGSYGQKKIKTPRLDQLALEGMRFTRNYSGNAVCALALRPYDGQASGACFHTQQRRSETRRPKAYPKSEFTMAEMFKGEGYATGAFGKWGLGSPGSEGDPLKQGFDRFFGYNCQRHAHSYYPNYLWSDEKRVPLDNEPPVPGHASLPKGSDPNDPRSYERVQGQGIRFRPHQRRGPQVRPEEQGQTLLPLLSYFDSARCFARPDEDLKPYLAQKWNDPPFSRHQGYGYTPHFTPEPPMPP